MSENSKASSNSSKFRWVIVALLFYSTTIVYFNRLILGILAPGVQSLIGWREQEYGHIVFAFQMSYAIGTVILGYVIDKLGSRLGFSLAVIAWALVSLPHSLASTWLGFAFARFGSGLEQTANFPASIKTVAQWFPKKELDYILCYQEDAEKIKIPWKKLIRYRQTWTVALGKLFVDPVWYFKI